MLTALKEKMVPEKITIDKQTETAKKMFIHLHKLAKATDDKKVKNFCGYWDILKVFEMHDINGHIKWEK